MTHYIMYIISQVFWNDLICLYDEQTKMKVIITLYSYTGGEIFLIRSKLMLSDCLDCYVL